MQKLPLPSWLLQHPLRKPYYSCRLRKTVNIRKLIIIDLRTLPAEEWYNTKSPRLISEPLFDKTAPYSSTMVFVVRGSHMHRVPCLAISLDVGIFSVNACDAHLASSPGHSQLFVVRFSRANNEQLGVAWGRG